METLKVMAVLLTGALLLGLSSCGSVRTLGSSAAPVEDFSNCANRECFIGLKSVRLIESEPQDGGGERAIYAAWSGAKWERHRFDNLEPLYIYFEVYFDANGSASNIRVGKPLCAFERSHQRRCIILSAGEDNAP